VLKLNDELKWKIGQRGKRNNDKFWPKAVNWANSNTGHIYAIFWLIGWVMEVRKNTYPSQCASQSSVVAEVDKAAYWQGDKAAQAPESVKKEFKN
jgi:hypothetical protein